MSEIRYYFLNSSQFWVKKQGFLQDCVIRLVCISLASLVTSTSWSVFLEDSTWELNTPRVRLITRQALFYHVIDHFAVFNFQSSSETLGFMQIFKSTLPNDELLTEIFPPDWTIFFFCFFLSRIRSLWAFSNSSKRTLVFTLASLSTTNDNDSCHFLCNSTITYIMIRNKTPQPHKYPL